MTGIMSGSVKDSPLISLRFTRKKLTGKNKLDETMKSARKRYVGFYLRSPGPVIDTTVTSLMKLLNANSYQKGAWVLHMLRVKIGDEHFWNGMRSFYETYRNKNALTGDFQRVMEKASNQDLTEFFREWLYIPGQPDLKITTKKNRERHH